MTDWTPLPMTEWDEALIRDCAWASLVMLLNKGTLGSFPTTRATREALARAAGKPEGQEAAAPADLVRGAAARYGIGLRASYTTGGTLLAALRPGVGAAVMGFYAKLPARLQRFDNHFALQGSNSYHCVYVERRQNGQIWWIDPLFHGESGYRGEYVSEAVLTGFTCGYGHAAWYVALGQGSISTSQAGPAQPIGEAVSVVHLSGGPSGVLTVKNDPAIRWIDLATSERRGPFDHGMPFGVPGTVEPPVPGGAVGEDRKTGYQCEINGRPSFFLKSNVTLAPVVVPVPVPAPAPDCSAVTAALAAMTARVEAGRKALA